MGNGGKRQKRKEKPVGKKDTMGAKQTKKLQVVSPQKKHTVLGSSTQKGEIRYGNTPEKRGNAEKKKGEQPSVQNKNANKQQNTTRGGGKRTARSQEGERGGGTNASAKKTIKPNFLNRT